jgi:hypothetical protein
MSHPDGPTSIKVLAVNTNTAAALIDSTEAALEKDRAVGHMGVPFVRAGRHIIYSINDLQLWLKANRVIPRGANDLVTSQINIASAKGGVMFSPPKTSDEDIVIERTGGLAQ